MVGTNNFVYSLFHNSLLLVGEGGWYPPNNTNSVKMNYNNDFIVSYFYFYIVFFPLYLGASKQLAMVVEGESLINDGTAIVFYNVFVKLATSEEGLTGRENTSH